MELRPHQIEAKNKLSNGKILWGGVGTGKSITVLSYYLDKESPKDIYVITTAKKRDSLEWDKDAASLGISTNKKFSIAGKLTVDSWNNIDRYLDIEDAFFVFDEQRVVGSGKWSKTFIKIAKKNRWVLLSATPGDTWMDYIPVFVANGLYRNATQFKQEHVVYAPFSNYPRIVRYTNVGTLEKYRNLLLVEMPYEKHTNRIVKEIDVEFDSGLFKKVSVDRWNPYEDQPIKDVGELFRLMRKVVNTSPDRLNTIISLIQQHKKLIVFYNFDYELEILRTLSSKGYICAEWNGHRKQPIPDTDTWVYLVQYVAGAEGWNCTETDSMAFYSLTYSYKNLEQSMGRIDRLNTPFTNLYYYILMSNSVIDRAVRKAQKEKKLFNERIWAFQNMGISTGFEGIFAAV